MKGLIRRVGSGERGFTLIELLVVIAILGIIAAVVVLNIGSFLGSGAKESANTEAHQVQTAVIAYMVANSDTSYTGGAVGPDTEVGPWDYLLNPGQLQATYSINTDGTLGTATKTSDSKWGDLTFTDGAWS